MDTRSDLDDLKSRVNLAALIRHSGVELKQVGKNLMGRCPFHDDSTASLSVNGQLWNCFGCEAGGDAFDWVQLKEKASFSQAVERLKQLVLQLPAPPPTNGRQKSGVIVPSLMERIAERYHQRLKECSEAQEYLRSRGLGSRELWEQFQIGYCDGTLAATMPESGPTHQALLDLGLLGNKGREHFTGCVVVPLSHPDLGIVNFYGRKIQPDGVPHLYLPGPKRGVLHWQTLKQAPRVVVAESVLDALSIWQTGLKDVTCLFGTSSVPVDLEALAGRFGTPEMVLCLDGDLSGLEASKRHSQRLQERGIRCWQVQLPNRKDPNQILCESGPQILKELVLAAKPLVHEATAAPVAPEVESNDDGFSLTLDDVRYQLAMQGPFQGRLRCTLIASRGLQLYSEKLDLHSHRSRALSIGQMSKVLDLPRLEVERHLTAIHRLAIDWAGQHKSKEATPLRPKAPELSEQDQSIALEWLRQPDLVRSILEDCQALGFVGEEKAKLLAYLIGVSRKLPKPLSGIVISQSGAGKSTLTEMVEMLTPPEDVLLYSRLTPAALYYMDHNLTGLLLILEERSGGEAADYSIRTLQSRQILRLAVPLKDPTTGKITTQTYEVKGPVAYLETTTNPILNPENSSRCFELFMDETEAQTQRIFTQQRLNRLVPEFDPDTVAEAICKKHHNAQRMLKSMRVYVPFAASIAFPSRSLRTRRDHERFLCLVEAIAFLHQHQRERGQTAEGKPYILANLEDYRLAYELARDVLASTLHELSRESQELWGTLVAHVTRRQPQQPLELVFTLKDLRQETNLSNHRLRASMQELVEMEYVGQLAAQNGKPFQFRLLTTDIHQPTLGLLTPDELAQRLRDGR